MFSAAFFVVLCFFLHIFLPARLILIPVAGLLVLGIAWKFPKTCLLMLLVLLLVQPMALLVMKFLQMPDTWVAAVSAVKEAGMATVLLSLVLDRSSRLTVPDIFLVGLLLLALISGVSSSTPDMFIGLKDDFDFVLAYGVGRVLITDEQQQFACVRLGLVAIAVVAALGVVEFIFLGPAPRMLLEGLSSADQLSPTFGAEAFHGYRAASTLTSPIELGHICTIALLFFVAYRHLLKWPYWIAAVITAAGLIVSVTRSAWMGAVIGLCLIAVRVRQKLKLALLLLAAICALFIAAPLVGISDFLSITLKGKEPSLQGHMKSLSDMTRYVVDHPLGSGPGSAGVRAVEREPNAPIAESSYLHFGLEYGLAGTLLFAAFCASVIIYTLRDGSTFGIAASAVALAFTVIYAFVSPPIDFPGATWTWLPIGLAIRSRS